MKNLTTFLLLTCFAFLLGCAETEEKVDKFDFTGSNDAALIRGFNYTPANVKAPRHHTDSWVKYDSATTEFDLDLAKSLNLNQTRIFIMYDVFTEDKEAFPGKLKHFVRACHERGIGVMPVVGYGPWLRDSTQYPLAREWAQYLIDAIGDEPGLAMWDVMNEPDWPPKPNPWYDTKFEGAKKLSKIFRELDPNTPVTIGAAFVDGMIELANYVDVLQFHDYTSTREEIRSNIKKAKAFASEVNKPLINGEMGCIARANPYDITLQEHMEENVGWYIWELMIVREGWGNIHGVFYEDGTVRDPSIAAAIMGYFRKRSVDIMPAVTDNEGRITQIVNQGTEWLNQSDNRWEEGLRIAETAAFLMEAGELVAMRIPPTWEVNQLREGEEDIQKLKDLLKKFIETLRPFILEKNQE